MFARAGRALALLRPHAQQLLGRSQLRPPARPLTTAGAGAAAGAAVTGPVSLTVEGLAAVQLHTGLPWWVAISGSAVALRIALLPALWYQLSETRRFVALRPQFAVVRAEVAQIADPSARASAYLRGVWRTARAAGVQPLAVVGMPLLQIPLLIVAILAVRRLVLEPASEARAASLRQGGAAWFTDLTAKDASRVLPLAAVVMTVANFQLAFSASRNPVWGVVRDLFQGGCVVLFPFYAELPAGVFLYWVPNSLWSLAQTAAVRRTAASQSLRGMAPAATAPAAARLPAPAAPAPAAPAASAGAAAPAFAAPPHAPPVTPPPAAALGAAAAAAAPAAPLAPAAPAAGGEREAAAPAAEAAAAGPAAGAAAPAEAASEEERALRDAIERTAAQGELRAWVVAHVPPSQLQPRLGLPPPPPHPCPRPRSRCS